LLALLTKVLNNALMLKRSHVLISLLCFAGYAHAQSVVGSAGGLL
jgi:hypothetical protein